MNRINSLPIMVIALLQGSGRRGLTADEIAETILNMKPWLFSRMSMKSREKMAKYVENRLEELAELGLVGSSREGVYELAWISRDSTFELAEDDDTAPPVSPPPATSSGSAGDGEGIGVRELLIHPILFSMGNDDFHDLLTRILGADHDR